ncbi:MAG: hypothetical protein S4CHLAM20_13140 [Chlamydiia bacterium]|nr:hypothetical protein [Chlamydiia bacterium]
MKKVIIFLSLCTASLFSAKIGFLCHNPHPESTILQHWQKVKAKLNAHNHNVEIVIINSRKRPVLSQYDILIGLYDSQIPKSFKNKTILYMMEPPVIIPGFADLRRLQDYLAIFTWNHAICDNNKYYKAFFPCLGSINPQFIPFKDRKFSCLINSELSTSVNHPEELYSKRAKVAKFYNAYHPEDLTLHGIRGWQKHKLSIFKGGCKDKHLVMRQHKFCYCFENWDNDYHYISEKLFDCFQNRCVPIYLGSKNITEYVPKEAFIDARNFSSIAEIHEFISNMDEQTWLTYVKAIETYHRSDKSKFFNPDDYATRVANVVLDKLAHK